MHAARTASMSPTVTRRVFGSPSSVAWREQRSALGNSCFLTCGSLTRSIGPGQLPELFGRVTEGGCGNGNQNRRRRKERSGPDKNSPSWVEVMVCDQERHTGTWRGPCFSRGYQSCPRGPRSAALRGRGGGGSLSIRVSPISVDHISYCRDCLHDQGWKYSICPGLCYLH